MAVVQVRNVRMVMLKRAVCVFMRVRLTGRIVGDMSVLVMLVVCVAVIVSHHRVGMGMAVSLPHEQAKPTNHQQHCGEFSDPKMLPENRDTDRTLVFTRSGATGACCPSLCLVTFLQ